MVLVRVGMSPGFTSASGTVPSPASNAVLDNALLLVLR